MIDLILAAVTETLVIMGWMGIVLFLLVFVNTVCKTIYNVISLESAFSWKCLGIGLGRAVLFYVSSVFAAIAFTILPFINTMTADAFGVEMISGESLELLSGLGILATCISVIVMQGKKAIEGISKLGEISSNTEQVTWEVEED